MKKNMKNMVALGAIGAVSLASIGTVSAAKNTETREAMHAAIENQDYAVFQEVAPEKKLKMIDTEDKFNKVVEMHALKEAGSHEEARVIADELGLKNRGQGGHRNAEAHAAVEAGDWSAFQSATEGDTRGSQIDTEDKFNKLVEAHTLREGGDRAGARVIMAELGIEKRDKGHDKRGHNPEARQAVDNANYSAFQEATADKKFGEKIDSQEKFNKLVEANQLRKDGQYDEARAIMDELGFEKRGDRDGHRSGGQHRQER